MVALLSDGVVVLVVLVDVSPRREKTKVAVVVVFVIVVPPTLLERAFRFQLLLPSIVFTTILPVDFLPNCKLLFQNLEHGERTNASLEEERTKRDALANSTVNSKIALTAKITSLVRNRLCLLW